MNMKKGQGRCSIKNQKLIFKFYELKKGYESKIANISEVQHAVAHSGDPESMAMATCSANMSSVEELRVPETQDFRYQGSIVQFSNTVLAIPFKNVFLVFEVSYIIKSSFLLS